ncbi:hypothetical protein [Agromyces mariniharenae]|uniref:Uncharacterized protein n=1 Tax=Agromyces mariniharenae TaxID=2604423 RepID=A0A5S4V7Y3_9MICO|nr:hypothetical protein [Agromyces mariniharenae]TYL53391.1 hypothetical protein FYC51_06840 [Agromyces mariniharenae]
MTGSFTGRIDRGSTDGARPPGWAIAVLLAALLIGALWGWTVSHSTPSEPDAAAVPIADTAVLSAYDTAPTPADVPRDAYPRDPIAPTEYRLLRTRPDGVALYIARLHGGSAVCAVLSRPGRFTTSSCTHEGLFPVRGLEVEASAPGDGLVRGVIRPDGSAELSPR